MANRSPGEGTIVQRKDGRFQASLMVGGKRRTVYGKTKAEAARKLTDLKKQADRAGGTLPDPGRRTVAELLALWLETSEPNLKPKTIATYHFFADTYILPTLSNVRLSRLEPGHLQRLYAVQQAKGHARTAEVLHRILHKALSLAVMWGWLAASPADRVVAPKHHSERKEMWTPWQLRAFLKGAQGHWQGPLWLAAIASGCRVGELLALQWADVDLAAGCLRVSKSVQPIGGEWVVSTPKTRAGERTISLPPEGVAALKRQRSQQVEWRLSAGREWPGGEAAFTMPTGLLIWSSTITRALQGQCKRLGLPYLTMHGLRHLHASLLLSQGVSVPLVSQRLGHANPAITLQVYAHPLGRGDEQAAVAIGKALAGVR